MEPKKVVSRYFELLERGDWENIVSLFDRDAVLVDHENKRHEGIDNIRGYFTGEAPRFEHLHISHTDNPVIADFTISWLKAPELSRVHETFVVEGDKIRSLHIEPLVKVA